jgi:hypothetical protein
MSFVVYPVKINDYKNTLLNYGFKVPSGRFND